MKFYSWAVSPPNQVEVNNKPSDCVPNQSISLRDMINNHMQGGSVRTYSPVYTGIDNTVLPVNFERLSKVDKAQLQIDLADFVTSERGRMMTRREKMRRDADRSNLEASRPPVVSTPVHIPDTEVKAIKALSSVPDASR